MTWYVLTGSARKLCPLCFFAILRANIGFYSKDQFIFLERDETSRISSSDRMMWQYVYDQLTQHNKEDRGQLSEFQCYQPNSPC